MWKFCLTLATLVNASHTVIMMMRITPAVLNTVEQGYHSKWAARLLLLLCEPELQSDREKATAVEKRLICFSMVAKGEIGSIEQC